MDKVEHFLRKNHHRVLYYFTDREEILNYILVLSIYEGTLFMVDIREGGIGYMDTGQMIKRFYVEDCESQQIPESAQEHPVEALMRDQTQMKEAMKILLRNQYEGTLVIMGPKYMMEIMGDGSFKIRRLMDFPDTLVQHGLFYKYDLEYFYNNKNTIAHNIQSFHTSLHTNFMENLALMQKEWSEFSRDPSRYLAGLQLLLDQYEERNRQSDELRKLVINMYLLWKELTNEHDMLDNQNPVSFDQSLQLNQKKQEIFRKIDRMKLIEKHATDLLCKIHISQTSLLFSIHVLSCEMSKIYFRVEQSVCIQEKINQTLCHTPSGLLSLLP